MVRRERFRQNSFDPWIILKKCIAMFLKHILLAVVVIVLIFVVSFLYLLSMILYLRWRFRNLPSPKARSLLLGHTLDVKEIEQKGGHVAMLLTEWRKIHGSVFVVFMVIRGTVVCLEPEVVKDLMITLNSRKSKQLYKLLKNLFGIRFLGNGLVTQLDNTKWEKQRKTMDPAFKRGYLKQMIDQFDNSAGELVDILKSKADGNTRILMSNQFKKVSLDIIAKVAFGLYDLNSIKDEDAIFSKVIERSLAGYALKLKMSFFTLIDPRKDARKKRSEIRDACLFIRQFGENCILQRLQDIKENQEHPKDILSYILSSYQDRENVNNEDIDQMIDEFATFFVAGQETTSELMSFFCEYVGRHPRVYQKLKEEIDCVIGDKPSVSYEDTTKLVYMNLVLKEVLRIAPPVTGIQRTNDKDIFVNGLRIPAGSNIGMNHYAMGRDERFWDEPEIFKPERFEKQTDGRHLYAYFPFALGPRSCIGQHFAMLEAKVVLSKLLQAFDFTLDPDVELKTYISFTLKSVHKTPLFLSPRSGKFDCEFMKN